MITLKSCPLCRSEDVVGFPWIGISKVEVRHKIMPGVAVDAKIVTYYSECQTCQLIFQNPRLTEANLEKYYSQGYYRKFHHFTTKEADDGELKRAKKDAEIIKKNIPVVSSHLDIGCSRGFLLDEIGAKVKVGVEPNATYVKAKGIRIYAKLELVPKKKYDLVSAIHVLEHVTSPDKLLATMMGYMNPDGFLVIEVPKSEYNGMSPDLAHLYQFRPHVFRRMCVQAGLNIIYEEFTPHLFLICKKGL